MFCKKNFIFFIIKNLYRKNSEELIVSQSLKKTTSFKDKIKLLSSKHDVFLNTPNEEGENISCIRKDSNIKSQSDISEYFPTLSNKEEYCINANENKSRLKLLFSGELEEEEKKI